MSKIIFQTSREKLQNDVINHLKLYMNHDWTYLHFTDEDIITFFNENPDPEFPDMISKFNGFTKGTNKSDFFRAYFLYKKGGVFLDSDAMITRNIEEIVCDHTFFSVISGAISGTIFNGFVGCTQGHPIMYEHLKYLYYTSPLLYEKNYFLACYNLYELCLGRKDVKLFNERITYDTYVWETYDPLSGHVHLQHYPFTKLVPTEYLRVYDWPTKVRLGNHADGGYVIGDHVGHYDCYISCGIGGDETFSIEFVDRYDIKTSYGFDGTVKDTWSYPTATIQYVPKNIGTTCDDENTSNLVDILSQHTNVFLKMDIEGYEFKWVEFISTRLLKNIKQMVIEFHGINDDTWGTTLVQKRQCFEKISQTHCIIHAHGNNWAQKTNHIPDVIELTFIRRDVFDTPPRWNTQKFPIQGLDRPNNPGAEDYFLGFPPFLHETFDYVVMEQEERPCAKRIATWIRDTLHPQDVLDIGCGPGMYVDELLQLGISARGIEISPEIQKPYVTNKSLFDMTHEDVADVVLCMEVAEHIPESRADDIVCHVTNATRNTLVWTAAIPGQGGVGHINCQSKDYWREKFIAQGLVYDEHTTEQCRHFISQGCHMGWFMNNVQIFKKPSVTLTITTCKRLHAFCQTMDSLMKHCKDLPPVTVVDDSSSESDRRELQTKYPFIQLITHEKKNHAHSLNIIRESVKSDYILMFEDDWIVHEDFTVNEILNYMHSKNIDNLRLNTIFMNGNGQVVFCPAKMSSEHKQWCIDHGYTYPANTDGESWPGFSLNPIMLHKTVLDEPFNEDIPSGFMEFDYAIRHVHKTWYGKDIGGIRHMDGNVSAYVLNNTHRWWD